jgi:hypothetical protein
VGPLWAELSPFTIKFCPRQDAEWYSCRLLKQSKQQRTIAGPDTMG